MTEEEIEIIHVLNDEASPPAAEFWVTQCGIRIDTMQPAVDFYTQNCADKSNCDSCRRQLGLDVST